VNELRSRYEGCLLGLAAGDALGATVEFKRPGSFPPLTDIIEGELLTWKKDNGR